MSNAHSHVKNDNVSPANAVGTFFSNRAAESTSIIKQTANRAEHVAHEAKSDDHDHHHHHDHDDKHDKNDKKDKKDYKRGTYTLPPCSRIFV